MAGATGWTGSAIAAAVVEAPDLKLASCVARSRAGGEVVGAPCRATVAEALEKDEFDVLIDYTLPDVVKDHVQMSIAAGRHVIVGTSGLTAADYEEIDGKARAAGVGVIASGNFAITAALATRFSLLAAEYLDQFEVVDFAAPGKIDAPSGTARELAERMGDVKKPRYEVALHTVIGEPGLRGGTVNGVQVHCLRLPSYSATMTTQFANEGSRLIITHDAGTDATIYAQGTLLAARKISGIIGLLRGLDNIL